MTLTEKKDKAEKLVLGSIAYFGVDSSPNEILDRLGDCNSDLFLTEKSLYAINYLGSDRRNILKLFS